MKSNLHSSPFQTTFIKPEQQMAHNFMQIYADSIWLVQKNPKLKYHFISTHVEYCVNKVNVEKWPLWVKRKGKKKK